MITSEFECLDRAYEIQVFPQPNAPGIAQVPPRTDGKRASSTLYPVRSGTSPASFSRTGLGFLTAHWWDIETRIGLAGLSSFSISRIVSLTLYIPCAWILDILPLTLGGTMTLWHLNRLFSCTVPRISPPVTISPSFHVPTGLNSHYFTISREGMSTPLGTKMSGAIMAIVFSGRWIPSKIFSMIPGPNSTDNGLLVLNTGSLIVKPAYKLKQKIEKLTCILIALDTSSIPIEFDNLTHQFIPTNFNELIHFRPWHSLSNNHYSLGGKRRKIRGPETL